MLILPFHHLLYYLQELLELEGKYYPLSSEITPNSPTEIRTYS